MARKVALPTSTRGRWTLGLIVVLVVALAACAGPPLEPVYDGEVVYESDELVEQMEQELVFSADVGPSEEDRLLTFPEDSFVSHSEVSRTLLFNNPNPARDAALALESVALSDGWTSSTSFDDPAQVGADLHIAHLQKGDWALDISYNAESDLSIYDYPYQTRVSVSD